MRRFWCDILWIGLGEQEIFDEEKVKRCVFTQDRTELGYIPISC